MRKSVVILSVISILLLAGVPNLSAFIIYDDISISSSPNPVGSGARAVGMGGAFIGVADDATAASWNPSGLIQLEKPELSIVGAYVLNQADFSTDDNTEMVSDYKDDFGSLNYVSASYPFSLGNRNMVVSIDYQRLYEFNLNFEYRYEETVPLTPPFISLETQQDVSYEQDGYLGALGLAYAVELAPALSLGFTFNVWTDALGWKNGWEETLNVHSVTTVTNSLGDPETTVNDVGIKNEYSGFTGWNANLGMLWAINQYVTLGAVLKTPFTADLERQYSRDDTGTSTNEDLELDMPMSYGLGVAWRFSDQFSIDLDVYRTHWSDYILEDENGNKFSPIDGKPASESDVGDTTQVRFGGEYLIIRPDQAMVIPLRAGLFYDPEPAHDGTKDFYGLSLGSGIGYKRFIVDLAYQLRWGRDVETDSLIANSTADITQHTVLLSVIYHF